MNREVKFRGKNSKGEWVIGDLLRNRGETFIAPDGIANPLATADDFKVDPETVGQFTSLLDKNGKEIYEGDVIECIDSHREPIRHQILFNSSRGCICQYGTKIETYCDDYHDYGAIHQGYITAHEKYVIGNIHDNPELLK